MSRYVDHLDEDEPVRDEQIEHTTEDGESTGQWSRVRYLISSDKERGLYEVMDEFNREIIVSWCEDHWLQEHP